MARLTNSSVSPSEGTFQVLCLAVTSPVVTISLYIDFDICSLRSCVRWNRISALEKKEKGGPRLLVPHLLPPQENKSLSRVAPALAAACRGLRGGKAEMEQHFHLVVLKKQGKPCDLGTSSHAAKARSQFLKPCLLP